MSFSALSIEAQLGQTSQTRQVYQHVASMRGPRRLRLATVPECCLNKQAKEAVVKAGTCTGMLLACDYVWSHSGTVARLRLSGLFSACGHIPAQLPA